MFTKARITALILAAAALMANCGGTTTFVFVSNPPVPGGASSGSNGGSSTFGSLNIIAHDAPSCDVVAFSLTITGVSLNPQGGGTSVPVLTQPVTVDFATLMGASTVLNLGSAPAGTYTGLTVTMANAQLGTLNPSLIGMGSAMMNANLSQSTVTVNLDRPLQVTNGGAAAVTLDMNLMRSIMTDATGQVTGSVDPSLTALMSSGGMINGLDDLHGIVQAVTTTSSDRAFQGSFTLQQMMMGRTFTVEVSSTTVFDGASGLNALAAGDFVEVEAFVDAENHVVAKHVEVEGPTNLQDRRGAFSGLITSITRDGSGNATQFSAAIRDEDPDMRSMLATMESLAVTVTPSTRFHMGQEMEDLAGWHFDASMLGVGQSVVVTGQLQPGKMGMMGGSQSSLNADSVVLNRQSVLGNFSRQLPSGSNGSTGGFTLQPCSSMFGSSMSVLTFNQTSFSGVSGLSGLSPGPSLMPRGFLFYVQRLTQVGGVPVAPPAWVFVSDQVQQLQ
jgi:uncharacterized protein DUF4382/uncharacterized protein DUF5666